LSRLGSLLPIEAGNRLLIAACVVLALGIGVFIAGISAVKKASVAVGLEEQGLFYVGSERTESRAAMAPDARTSRVRMEQDASGAPWTGSVHHQSPTGLGAVAAPGSSTAATRVQPDSVGMPETQPVGESTAESQEAPAAEPADRKSRVELDLLDEARLAQAKAGFCTRRVPIEDMRTLVSGHIRPRAGDVALARIERVRQHKRIELTNGRKARLEPGDEVILACGNRYAADQFEGFVPDKLGPAHLIAAGGMAAVAAQRTLRMRAPTAIRLLGLVANESGIPLNLASYALPAPEVKGFRPPVIGVFGTSMNSGKTTAVCFLCRGLTGAGFKVGYAKLTGTGAGNDHWRVLDSGALEALDFTDAGLASTYGTPVSVLEVTSVNLVGHLVARGCDRIVVEIADGLLQGETHGLMHSDAFRAIVDRVVFTGGDAMSAIAGVSLLKEHGFDVACVSGLLTTSPLALREAVGALDVPVLCNEDLASPEMATRLVNHEALPLEMGCGRALRQTEGEHGQSAQLDEGFDTVEEEE
jgi:hypothetical protein